MKIANWVLSGYGQILSSSFIAVDNIGAGDFH